MESSQDSVVDRLDELDAETAAFYREQYDDDGLAADVAGAAAKGTWVAGKMATKAALKTTVFTGKALGKVAKLALGAAGGGGVVGVALVMVLFYSTNCFGSCLGPPS